MTKKIDRTGEIKLNNQGLEMKIINYRSWGDLDVVFNDGTVVSNKNYGNFLKGKILNKNYDYGRTGEVRYNHSQHEKMTIIKYSNYNNITVEFEDGTIVNTTYNYFKNGAILNPNKDSKSILFNDRVNEEVVNQYGTTIKILQYLDANNIVVEFQDEYKYRTDTTYWAFKNGAVKNPYDKTVYGVGCLGVGKYKPQTKDVKSPEYKLWKAVLNRCYGANNKKNPCYRGCKVCDEWLIFQNFAEWYNENYYSIDGENIHLDKDILIKGNKIYSPETCIFVPQRINALFVKNKDYRNGTVIGVMKNRNRYVANIFMEGKAVSLGRYKTEIEAFNHYKKVKEQYIKQIADEYKDKIPQKLYDAMYNYEVEIDD